MFAALAMTMGANAQGNNIGMGGGDGDIQSIHERITKLEKKNDMFNLYFNYAASFQAEHNSLSDEWGTKFANKQLRIEIKGNLTDKLYYRCVIASTRLPMPRVRTTSLRLPIL